MFQKGASNMFYHLQCDENLKGKVVIPTEVGENLFLQTLDSIVLRAGNKKSIIQLELQEDLAKDTIILSNDVAQFLSIPLALPYQLKLIDEELVLGPLIGLLFTSKCRDLTPKLLKALLVFALDYSNFYGLLYVFSIDSIDMNTQTVNGYYYDSTAHLSHEKWKYRTFPIPDVLYNRGNYSSSSLRILKQLTGSKVFNSSSLDKWNFWQMTRNDPLIYPYIPYTKRLSRFYDIDHMLQQYGSILLKPIQGSRGYGIIKILKSSDGYWIQGKYEKSPTLFASRDAAQKRLHSLKYKKPYILQQALQPIKYDARCIDFRVIMQKDETLKWNCTAIVASLGQRNGLHSNYQSDALYLSFEEALSRALHLNHEEISIKRKEVLDTCKLACGMLDASNEHFGDIGIDILIDTAQKIWILEINKRHFHTVPLLINDEQLYYKVRNAPIRYSVGFSGFTIF